MRECVCMHAVGVRIGRFSMNRLLPWPSTAWEPLRRYYVCSTLYVLESLVRCHVSFVVYVWEPSGGSICLCSICLEPVEAPYILWGAQMVPCISVSLCLSCGCLRVRFYTHWSNCVSMDPSKSCYDVRNCLDSAQEPGPKAPICCTWT